MKKIMSEKMEKIFHIVINQARLIRQKGSLEPLIRDVHDSFSRIKIVSFIM